MGWAPCGRVGVGSVVALDELAGNGKAPMGILAGKCGEIVATRSRLCEGGWPAAEWSGAGWRAVLPVMGEAIVNGGRHGMGSVREEGGGAPCTR